MANVLERKSNYLRMLLSRRFARLILRRFIGYINYGGSYGKVRQWHELKIPVVWSVPQESGLSTAWVLFEYLFPTKFAVLPERYERLKLDTERLFAALKCTSWRSRTLLSKFEFHTVCSSWLPFVLYNYSFSQFRVTRIQFDSIDEYFARLSQVELLLLYWRPLIYPSESRYLLTSVICSNFDELPLLPQLRANWDCSKGIVYFTIRICWAKPAWTSTLMVTFASLPIHWEQKCRTRRTTF